MKPKKIQMSNWEVEALSDAQITYAAYDALMGREVCAHAM
jgi:ribonuclease D